MEKIKISEQEIVNAICLLLADQKGIAPEEVEVELLWDEDLGYSAEVYATGRKQIFVEANLIAAVRFWLEKELLLDPYAASLELVLDEEEGIIAYATYNTTN